MIYGSKIQTCEIMVKEVWILKILKSCEIGSGLNNGIILIDK